MEKSGLKEESRSEKRFLFMHGQLELSRWSRGDASRLVSSTNQLSPVALQGLTSVSPITECTSFSGLF